MKEFSCLAIDMGAGSIRGIMGEFGEKLILTEVFRFDNNIIDHDGHDRWNLDAIHQGIKDGVRQALEMNPGRIKSIAVDSWGVDFVLLSKDGTPLGFPVAYRDKRTDGMQEKWTVEYFSKEETFNVTGINFYPFNTLFQLLAIKGHPIWGKTGRLLFTANYISYYLSGVAANERSLSSTSQLMNIRNMNWDSEIMDALGLCPTIFGNPVECGQILGNLKPGFGDRTVKVCTVPSHDTASAIDAIPAENDNYAYISTGTWCIVGMPSAKPYTSKLALDQGITNEVNTSTKIKVNKNIMGLWLIQKLREALMPGVPYDKIDQLAKDCLWNGATIDPNNPVSYNPSNMHVAFDHLLEEQGSMKFKNAAEYFRCAYESIAKSFRETIEVLEQLRGKPFEVVHMIGGGTKSSLLCQLTANALNIPVIAGPVEGAAIGNLMWQARANGIVNDEKEISTYIRKSFDVKVYQPQS
jgi:sugar (pentulose or hexulose) kinase